MQISSAATFAVAALLFARVAAAAPTPAPTPLATPGVAASVAPAPASPAASATASPFETPSPFETASPAGTVPLPGTPPPATPGLLPSRRPIAVDRARAGIVPGTTVVIGVSGGAGDVLATADAPAVVDASYDAATHRLTLAGRAPGTTTVTLSDAAGDRATVAVLVAPAAGVVPTDADVALGGFVSPQFASARIQAAIVRSAQLQPGTTVDVNGVTLPSQLRPGDSLDVRARVHVDGHGAFVDRTGTTDVRLHVEALAQLDPAFLFYSDDPERLDANADGVLYRNTIDATHSARTYAYHVSDAADRRLYLTLRATGSGARVQILGDGAGPTDAFSYAGHVSTLRYLLARGTGESAIVTVTPDAPYALLLGTRPMRAGELVSAIYDLRVLAGDAVDVAIVAASGDADPVDMLDQAERAGDGHGRRGEFALAQVPPLALAYALGTPDPAPFSIGVPTIPNVRAGGRALGGDYGVLREVALQVSNPTNVAASAYLYEVAAGGTATTTLWFTGDPQPTEIPCVRVPQNRYLVREIPLAPGESRTVTGEYMTDGTSSFPLLFGLSGTSPSPPPGPYAPDACNPKPVPAAAPSPLASGTPPASGGATPPVATPLPSTVPPAPTPSP